MKPAIHWLVLLLVLVAPAAWAATAPVIVIHGGAGVVSRDMPQAEQDAIRGKLTEALQAGHALLKAGKPALDAVTAAINVLENDPHFNAGKGAVFTHEGFNAMDSSIMDGATLRAGAVAGVRHVKNPVLLARAVMEHSPHVMLAYPGAEEFAREQGIEMVDASYFRTEERWQELQRILKEGPSRQVATRGVDNRHFGTVGAVALDASGHIAAATSTGGMTNKRWDRIGDSPLIGAGTYANAACGLSATGWGEYYIRTSAAHSVCLRVERGEALGAAAEDVINKQIPELGGDGGAIVLDRAGNIATPFNTPGMFRGWIDRDGHLEVAIFAAEPRDGARAEPAPAAESD